jgi:F-box protein 18 (helicase)
MGSYKLQQLFEERFFTTLINRFRQSLANNLACELLNLVDYSVLNTDNDQLENIKKDIFDRIESNLDDGNKQQLLSIIGPIINEKLPDMKSLVEKVFVAFSKDYLDNHPYLMGLYVDEFEKSGLKKSFAENAILDYNKKDHTDCEEDIENEIDTYVDIFIDILYKSESFLGTINSVDYVAHAQEIKSTILEKLTSFTEKTYEKISEEIVSAALYKFIFDEIQPALDEIQTLISDEKEAESECSKNNDSIYTDQEMNEILQQANGDIIDADETEIDHPLLPETNNFINIAGVTFENRQEVCKKLYIGDKLFLKREHNNPYDEYAVLVIYNNEVCGYVPKNISKSVSIKLDTDPSKYFGIVRDIVGGGEYNLGIKFEIIKTNDSHIDESNDLDNWIDDTSFDSHADKCSAGNINLTEEQLEIVNFEISDNSSLKVIAFAGTGKTTTLLEYAKCRPNNSFLYVAFNKSIQTEAEKKFPINVICKTSHSLAYKAIGYRYKNKLIANLRLNEISYFLDIQDYSLVKVIYETLLNFLSSSDEKFKEHHLSIRNLTDVNFGKKVIKLAAKIFLAMKDENENKIGMIHDGYLKLYQLSKPYLDYDYILLDEAQDTTPAVSDIIISQSCKKIFVGDPHQQIYTFRGAENAMEKIDAEQTLYLTNSFRFTREIAEIGTKILRDFKFEHKSIVGKANEDLQQIKNDEFAIICRTNAKVFEIASNYKGSKLNFVGGVAGYKFNEILDIYNLKIGLIDKIQNKYISSFGSYANLISFSEETNDIEFKSKLKIIDRYNDNIPIMIKDINSRVVEKEFSDIILATAHKAKGSEFYKVKIADDFPQLVVDGRIVDPFEYDKDEFNLQYVAVTRAKFNLEFENENHWSYYLKCGRSDFSFLSSGFKDKPKGSENLDTNINRRKYNFRTEPKDVSIYPEDDLRTTYDILKQLNCITDAELSNSKMNKVLNDFTNLNNNKVIDHASSLMWLNIAPMEIDDPNDIDKFKESINKSNTEGYNDWRIPTLPELYSLLCGYRDNLNLNELFFFNRLSKKAILSSDTGMAESEYTDAHSDWETVYVRGKYGIIFTEYEEFNENFHIHVYPKGYSKFPIIFVRTFIPSGYFIDDTNLLSIKLPIMGYDMVYIPPGEFSIGCDKFNKCFSTEISLKPPYKKNIEKGFFIGKYPITNHQWNYIMKPSRKQLFGDFYTFIIEEENDDLSLIEYYYPLICEYYHMVDFLDRLRETLYIKINTNLNISIPTENEWEYCCKGGDSCFFFEKDISYFCWHEEISRLSFKEHVHEIGTMYPNKWGLYDMIGNVNEFVRSDDLASDQYDKEKNIIHKGGSWTDPKYNNLKLDSADNSSHCAALVYVLTTANIVLTPHLHWPRNFNPMPFPQTSPAADTGCMLYIYTGFSFIGVYFPLFTLTVFSCPFKKEQPIGQLKSGPGVFPAA